MSENGRLIIGLLAGMAAFLVFMAWRQWEIAKYEKQEEIRWFGPVK